MWSDDRKSEGDGQWRETEGKVLQESEDPVLSPVEDGE